MNAFQQAEFGRVGALDAITDAVESDFAQFMQVGGGNRAGVGFQADFGIRENVEMAVDGLEDVSIVGGGEQGGRAAAEEDGGDLTRPRAPLPKGEGGMVLPNCLDFFA